MSNGYQSPVDRPGSMIGPQEEFIMEYEKIGFIEAIQWLGEQYGIDVKLSQEERGNELFPNLYELHKEAMNLYHESLF